MEKVRMLVCQNLELHLESIISASWVLRSSHKATKGIVHVLYIFILQCLFVSTILNKGGNI